MNDNMIKSILTGIGATLILSISSFFVGEMFLTLEAILLFILVVIITHKLNYTKADEGEQNENLFTMWL